MNEKHLLKNGWRKEGDGWFWKTDKSEYGGYSLKEAIDKQKKHDLIDKNGAYYIARDCRYGFGKKILKQVAKGGKFVSTPFTHLSDENAQMIIEQLNDGLRETDFNLTPNQSKFEKIIIFKEKHGSQHFIAHNLGELEKIALKVFKERVEDEYWYDYSDLEEPVRPDISKEDAEKLKNEQIKRSVLEAWKSYEYDLKNNKEWLEEKRLYESALKDERGNIALAFLDSRRNGEYEGFEIIDAEII